MADNQNSPSRWSTKQILVVTCVCAVCAALVGVSVLLFEYSRTSRHTEVGVLTDREKCISGRLFFGSIHGTESDRFVGIYVEENNGQGSHPFYKHESTNSYLYYNGDGYWVIDDRNGLPNIRARGDSYRPDMHTHTWEVHDEVLGHWKTGPKLSCVSEAFMTCRNGKLVLSGIVSTKTTLNNFMGTYTLTDKVFSGRQVYRHDFVTLFLYYSSFLGVWIICREVQLYTIMYFPHMVVHDFASRPEYIKSMWTMYDPEGSKVYREQPNANLQCIQSTQRVIDDGVVPHPACVERFKYKGYMYDGCTNVDMKKYWCSRALNYSNGWEYCLPSYISAHPECRFPFMYGDTLYHTCTKKDSYKYWCATAPLYDSEKWVYCIDKGRRPHRKCTFPFTYNYFTFFTCLISHRGNAWCSTEKRYNGGWQYCS